MSTHRTARYQNGGDNTAADDGNVVYCSVGAVGNEM